MARRNRRLFWAVELLLLAGTVGASTRVSSAQEWRPAILVVLLLSLALLGQFFSVEIRGGQLSASLIAIVLAMSLLGPVAAAACGIAAMILKSAVRRLAPAQWLSNLTTFAVIPFAGGLLVRALVGNVHQAHSHGLSNSLTFGVVVFLVFLFATGLNFLFFALDVFVDEGRSLLRVLGELVPLLPGELAAGAIATMLALGYTAVGLPLLFGSIVVLLIFQQLTVALLRSEDRAEQLLARSTQLVRLQLGVLSTLVKALEKRDETTGRHAAAVARYAEALSIALNCSEEQRDVARAAGLLHEIGKFTWPDRVLHASVVEEQDLTIVRNHPQEGAMLVGALDGYGEAAEAILHHHERVDGRGYPAGLIGNEIPLMSRVLAICSTYDTLTAQGTYRPAIAPEEAMEELRSAARNGQLDGEMVETFITVLGREGAVFGQDSDFEVELEFERRVRMMAEPRAGVTGRSLPAASRLRSRARTLGSRSRALVAGARVAVRR
ncbi:MAG TPA: HD domain-containing phosphohydrolase [Solirubrobacteraceae bacterium]|nr:HD domain-containing phosphohydrolase [Solirubrobacteraceae bacterium]